MPDWSKGRGQTKSDPLAFHVGGLAQGQQPCPVKYHYVTETATEDTTTTVCCGLSESPQETTALLIIMLFRQTAQRKKHKHCTLKGLRSLQHCKLGFYSPLKKSKKGVILAYRQL